MNIINKTAANTLKSTSKEEFLTKIAKVSPKILHFKTNHLHIEYTRFLPFCNQVKGLSLDKALLQLKWDRRLICSQFTNSLSEAIVKAKESGYDLNKTFIADAHSENEGILSRVLLKRFVRGRGRYGAIPHVKSALVSFILQEREVGFTIEDKNEWIKDLLREKQKPWAKTAEEVYQKKRQERPLKIVYN